MFSFSCVCILPSCSHPWPCRSLVRLSVSICEPGWLVSSRPALELYQEAALCARPHPGPAEKKPPARDIFRHSLIK